MVGKLIPSCKAASRRCSSSAGADADLAFLGIGPNRTVAGFRSQSRGETESVLISRMKDSNRRGRRGFAKAAEKRVEGMSLPGGIDGSQNLNMIDIKQHNIGHKIRMSYTLAP